DAVIQRESARSSGVELFLRGLAFAAGCTLTALLIWRLFAFCKPMLRGLMVALALATVLLWAPFVGRMIRFVAPGIELVTGLDAEEAAADPAAPFYDAFDNGPPYADAPLAAPTLLGVKWTPQNSTSPALVKWLRTIPVAPVRGSFDKAEDALTAA